MFITILGMLELVENYVNTTILVFYVFKLQNMNII